MRKPTQYIFLTFFIIPVALSCRKTENKDILPLSRYYKDRYVYQPGSYWIYYDSITGNIDSFALVSTTRSTSSGTLISPGHWRYSEQFYMKIREFAITDSTYRTTWYLQTSPYELAIDVHDSVDNYPSNLFSGITPTTMETTSYVSQHGFYQHHKVELLTAYSLNGRTMDSVYKVIIEQDSSASDNIVYHDTLYVSGQIGLIKIARNDWKRKSNLNLIRYNVLRN